MKLKRNIWTTLLIVAVLGLVSLLYSGHRYITKLEQQIIERDLLIDKLTISDALVKEYFDVKQDSLTNELIYTLKSSKQEPVEIIYRNQAETFMAGDKVITPSKLAERYNSLIDDLNQYDAEHNKLIDTYNNLAKDYSKLVRDYNKLVKAYNEESESEALKAALDMIRKEYDITYNIQKDSTKYIVKLLPSHKIDSALMLLPYFRNNLKFDEESNAWIITRQVVVEKQQNNKRKNKN